MLLWPGEERPNAAIKLLKTVVDAKTHAHTPHEHTHTHTYTAVCARGAVNQTCWRKEKLFPHRLLCNC